MKTTLLLSLVAVVLAKVEGSAQTPRAPLPGALAVDEPQAVYTDDPQDSWNRIFHCLFTRVLKIRLSEDFPEGAPFAESGAGGMSGKKVSTRIFERIESGDRAIEPLYPHEQFRAAVSAAQLLEEPRFSEIRKALAAALAEPESRPPLARALMQSDVWAAYDFLARDVTDWILKDAPIALFRERQAVLRGLLAPLIRKLALTSAEIQALPDNYAASGAKLPDLFGADSGWLEVQGNAEREHERAAWNRRAARVFLKPLEKPADRREFLGKGNDADFHKQIEAAALVIQNLLVNQRGEVVPSPLTYSVQIRVLAGGDQPKSFAEFELTRRGLLTNAEPGGLREVAHDLPGYVPGAGNDYSYASPIDGVPLAVLEGTRCAFCHTGNPIFTFATLRKADAPRVVFQTAQENAQAVSVAKAKMKTEIFRKMLEDWQ